MASNYTTNYQLNQWEAADQVLRTDFNADNSKIDAALKGLADKDAELEGTLAGQSTALDKLGTCTVDHFTYRGSGTYGSDGPTEITFSRQPIFFVIVGKTNFAFGSSLYSTLLMDLSNNNATASLDWSGNQVSFTAGRADWQLNTKSETYHVFAFYDMSEE